MPCVPVPTLGHVPSWRRRALGGEPPLASHSRRCEAGRGPALACGFGSLSQIAEMYNSAVLAYVRGMGEMTVSDARARLADVVDVARVEHDPVYLTRRGQRVAAVIDADDLDRLIAAAEDLADIEAARAARAEMDDGQPAIPWDEVKADLGLA